MEQATQGQEQQQQQLPIDELFTNPQPGVNYITKPVEADSADQQQQQEEQQQEQQEQQQTTPAFDEAAWLREKTGGKFEKWDDLWSRAEAQPQLQFENEQSKTVYEYLQKGETEKVAEFLILQQTLSSLDKASDADVIKMRMRIEEPDNEDIEAAFDTDYEQPVKGEMSDEQYAKAMQKYERHLKKVANEARAFLSERKAELKLPSMQQEQAADPKADFEKGVTETMATIHKTVMDAVPQVNEFTFQFNNDKGIVLNTPYKFTDKEKELASEVLKDYGQFFNDRYTTEGGGYDGKKLLSDILLLNNFENILQNRITEAVMNDRLNALNDRANYTAGRDIVSPAPVDAEKAKADEENKSKMREIWNA